MRSIYNPKPIHVKDEFYAVEETGRIPVSKTGFVLDQSGKPTRGKLYNNRYQYNGEFVHRLVALTFLPYDVDVEANRMVVNHLNGNPIDNRLENLEWTTYSGNIIHAYENGLRTDGRPVEVKNLETGETLSFYGLQEAARYLSANGGSLHYFMNNGKKKPFKGKYDVIYRGQEWSHLTKDDVTTSVRGQDLQVLAISIDEPKKCYIYPSVVQAANFMKVKPTTLRWYINRLGANKSNRHVGFDWYYVDDVLRGKVEDKTISELLKRAEKKGEDRVIKNYFKVRKPTKMKVTDLRTKEVTYFDGIRELSDFFNYRSYNSLQKYLWAHDGIISHYLCEYVKD